MEKNKAQILKWLGCNLKRIRKKSGYSQFALSELANIDYSYYGSVERGEKAITISKLSQITQALGVPLQSLFKDEQELSVKSISKKEEKIIQISNILKQQELKELDLVYNLISEFVKWEKKNQA